MLQWSLINFDTGWWDNWRPLFAADNQEHNRNLLRWFRVLSWNQIYRIHDPNLSTVSTISVPSWTQFQTKAKCYLHVGIDDSWIPPFQCFLYLCGPSLAHGFYLPHIAIARPMQTKTIFASMYLIWSQSALQTNVPTTTLLFETWQ